MTSYGRTAGIPNSLSPLVQWIQSFAPFGEDGGNYVVTDYSSDWQLYSENSMGNGYDNSYVPTYSDALSLMLMARTGQGAATTSPLWKTKHRKSGRSYGRAGKRHLRSFSWRY